MNNSNTGASVEIIRFLEWDETDAAGHHHYASVFRWVEELEAKLYRDLGLPVTLFGQFQELRFKWNIAVGFSLGKLLEPS